MAVSKRRFAGEDWRRFPVGVAAPHGIGRGVLRFLRASTNRFARVEGFFALLSAGHVDVGWGARPKLSAPGGGSKVLLIFTTRSCSIAWR